MYGGGRCEVFSDFLPSRSVSHWSHYIDSYRGAARCRCSLTLSSLMVLVQESKGPSHAVALLTEGFPACLGVQPTVCTSRPHSSNRSASAAPLSIFQLELTCSWSWTTSGCCAKCHRVLFKPLAHTWADSLMWKSVRVTFSCDFSAIVSRCFVPPCKACPAASLPT